MNELAEINRRVSWQYLSQHAYIWVHMYCTEAPDLALLYGATPPVPGSPDPSAPKSINPKHQ